MHDPLEKDEPHTHSLMGEVGGSSCISECVVEGSLVEAEALVSYEEGCEPAGGPLLTC